MLKRLSAFISYLLIFAIPIVFYTQKQAILDWWKLKDYTPTSRVEQLASKTTMNPYGKKLFYVNRPEIENKDSFHNNCTLSEQTIVLGCYVSNKGIYLLEVVDSRLSGVQEVTAAHEMLHAAYERLPQKEKTTINTLLEDQFSTITDERLKSTVEQYRQRDPSVVYNELHSILGTEVRVLKPELEKYYKKYFEDRLKIVTLSEQYESVFSELKNQVSLFDKQLSALKNTVDKEQSEMDSLGASLESQKIVLQSLLSSNKIEEYNRSVPGFNQQVKAYNSLISKVKTDINEYNSIVEKRNALATEQKSLLNAIDSRTITTQ